MRFDNQDVTDYDAIAAILAEDAVDVVFNLAVVPLPASLTRPRWSTEHNIELATVPCELLREGRFETLIHFSSSEAYGSAEYVPMDEKHPLDALDAVRREQGRRRPDRRSRTSHTFGIDAAILRPFNNFGPRQNAGAYAGIIPIVVQPRPRRPSRSRSSATASRPATSCSCATPPTPPCASTASRALAAAVVNVASGIELTINELVRPAARGARLGRAGRARRAAARRRAPPLRPTSASPAS